MAGLCEGRVAIVTGAGRGIGREHALMLASEGAKVVVNDLGGATDGTGSDLGPAKEVVAEIETQGGEAVVDGSDVTDFEAAGRLVAQTVETFGRLDVLVNNAGILRDRMIFSMSEAEWDAVVAVHLKGHFCATRHAAAHWRERSKAGDEVDARIINTASPSGLYGNAGQTNYGAAKAGIAALTMVEALELGRYGVTANCLAPTAVTRLVAPVMGGEDNIPDATKEALSPRWVAAVPNQRTRKRPPKKRTSRSGTPSKRTRNSRSSSPPRCASSSPPLFSSSSITSPCRSSSAGGRS